MNGFWTILENKALLAAVLGWTLAQLIKFMILLVRERKVNLRLLVAPGGMPSGHAASVMALSVSVGLNSGWASPLFAATFTTAMIVMYDAAGIRRAAGRQAAALNRIIDRLARSEPHMRKQLAPEVLRELLGHTPFQVLASAALGIAIALALQYRI